MIEIILELCAHLLMGIFGKQSWAGVVAFFAGMALIGYGIVRILQYNS